ncbi:trypsin-like serine protease [Thalassotalea ganghwensis]
MFKGIVAFLLILFSLHSNAIVTRHDVKQQNYVVEQAPGYFVDMPHEGQGVLIASQWVLTVAHVIFYDYRGKTLTIGGNSYVVEDVVVHQGFTKFDQQLLQQGTEAVMNFQYENKDIALVKLSKPVENVKPIALYQGQQELGKVVTGYGRGATGNGESGAVFETKRAKTLRKLNNRIDEVRTHWISITFDNIATALPLEGIDGSGDSGGPLIIEENGKEMLVGMFAWDYVEGPLSDFVAGLYGHKSYQVRVSAYLDWIAAIIKAQ